MPLNIAKPPKTKKSSNSMKRVFNSAPINFEGVNIDSLEQVSYTKFKVHSNMSIDSLLKSIKNSNPTLNFGGIIGDRFYDNEESDLINKPEKDVWSLEDLGKGMYCIQLVK